MYEAPFYNHKYTYRISRGIKIFMPAQEQLSKFAIFISRIDTRDKYKCSGLWIGDEKQSDKFSKGNLSSVGYFAPLYWENTLSRFKSSVPNVSELVIYIQKLDWKEITAIDLIVYIQTSAKLSSLRGENL